MSFWTVHFNPGLSIFGALDSPLSPSCTVHFHLDLTRLKLTQIKQFNKFFRPENLRVRREFIGGQRMEVSWDHPKAQRPENGYRLVFAPFADVIDQKPWIEVVDGDTNTVSSNFEPPIRESYDLLELKLRVKPPFTVRFVKNNHFLIHSFVM